MSSESSWCAETSVTRLCHKQDRGVGTGASAGLRPVLRRHSGSRVRSTGYFLQEPEDGRTHTRPPTKAEQTEAAPQMKDRDHVQHGKEAVRLGVLTRVSFAHLLRHEPPRTQKITSDQSGRHSF